MRSTLFTLWSGIQYGKYNELCRQIKAMVEIMQATGILPKEITQENCKHSIWIAKPKQQIECGICGKDISKDAIKNEAIKVKNRLDNFFEDEANRPATPTEFQGIT